MTKRSIIAVTLSLISICYVNGQTTREEVYADINKAGGVYYAYPINNSENTAPPKGYTPVYISHYGRHGSRYLISDNDYTSVRDILKKGLDAGALTPLGVDVLVRIDSLMHETEGRGGDLSPLGVKQHRGIAERMFTAYPEVFKGNKSISARSTVVVRCVLSMDAFCERLKELNPNLAITREASGRYMNYLNYHSRESQAYTSDKGPWREEYRKFENEHTNGDRLVASLFSNKDYIKKNINPHTLMWGLYWITVGMQDVETQLSFTDLFTPDELFDLWQSFNYRFYVCDGSYAGNDGMLVDNAKPLLRNIITSADAALSGKGDAATLRFGHDGNLIPLAALMHLKGCYESIDDPYKFYTVFSDFKIAPMAGNIQMIFFRNKAGDVIVKFMLNERETSIPLCTDIYPFYHWNDVREYFCKLSTPN
jgi:hypothetical protein